MVDFIINWFIGLWGVVTGTDIWADIGKALFKAIAILVIALIIVRVGNKVIGRIFESRSRGPLRITERREVTIKKLIQNSMKYTVYFIAFIMILDDAFGFDIGALLAGAGVAGLAIGFGAQNLVRDIISGFFIIFEDQFSVGDYILTAGAEGYVEEIGMRTTKIESWTGEQHVVPNGNVTQVTNYSIHNGLAIVDVNVPYENDVAAAEKIIGDVIKTLPDKHEEIVKVPEIFGVEVLDTSHFVLRVIAETLPSYQWKGARNIRKEIKEVLYKEGIQIPAPRLIMYSRNQEPDSLQIDPEREV
ncbi:MAG TPA: mechanosensitive ion channel family protein [Lentibacillus sp.]|uniref:mechanosensitive ion channel family protein n=1 Tax=Lentibacillus sp. TaxID=1925746 RepID=UPI002B4B2611|nr:mechanosensitive ion channel family protein [Lentibacillus sp.]HLR61213.1 mechanosensitive ion channel family protein [Lentibacillus sp.]